MIKVLCLVFILYSCQSEKGPDASLHDYINYRFSSGQDRDWLLEHTWGELNNRIQRMNEQELLQFTNMGHIKKKRVKINLKDCSASKCSITYTVKYIDRKSQFVVQTKKIATLVNIDGKWKVSDVNNIKSYMDSKKRLDIESS
ncbi:MAG: hypothetical protein OXB84_09045 [Halobacteriovoraceae bacterium]|nr:hypothetical protein [Halobacteriovoraceae bacterium]